MLDCDKAELLRAIERHVLFEVSLEVANQVGGVYTVIRSKVPITVQEYGERYILVGVYSENSQSACEVEECPLPVDESPHFAAIHRVLQILERNGVCAFTGRWLVEGSPWVILFHLDSVSERIAEWKADLWRTCKIPTPTTADYEIDRSAAFGQVVAWFLCEVAAQLPQDIPAVAHFHEWMSSVAIPLLRHRGVSVLTIFTTHATLLGRYLCAGSTEHFYSLLPHFSIDEEAGKRGIYERYCVERAAAHCCDVFTCVSDITAYEAECLLRRKPDGILPNGLATKRRSIAHELQSLHVKSKAKIDSFVQAHFHGDPVSAATDDAIYFFLAGRYEFRNKGIDLFLDALSDLNKRLCHLNSSLYVVAFLIVPAPNRSYTVETLHANAMTRQLAGTIQETQQKVGRRLFESALRGQLKEQLLDESDVVRIKRGINALKRSTPPSVVTHNMQDDSTDAILCRLRSLNLCNWPSDRAKVVFHPAFLSPDAPILGLEYAEFVRGCHLGCFPSYYEPWGYTPAECIASGVPAVTSNLCGFGCFMEERVQAPEDHGVYLLDRRSGDYSEHVRRLADILFDFCKRSRRQRIVMRTKTEKLAELFDWSTLGVEYQKARRLALYQRVVKSDDGLADAVDSVVL